MTPDDLCWNCPNKKYFPDCIPDRVERDNSAGNNVIINCKNYNTKFPPIRKIRQSEKQCECGSWFEYEDDGSCNKCGAIKKTNDNFYKQDTIKFKRSVKGSG